MPDVERFWTAIPVGEDKAEGATEIWRRYDLGSRTTMHQKTLSGAPALPEGFSEVSKSEEPNRDLVRPWEATPVAYIATSSWQKAR
jgi:hypothetical protein